MVGLPSRASILLLMSLSSRHLCPSRRQSCSSILWRHSIISAMEVPTPQTCTLTSCLVPCPLFLLPLVPASVVVCALEGRSVWISHMLELVACPLHHEELSGAGSLQTSAPMGTGVVQNKLQQSKHVPLCHQHHERPGHHPTEGWDKRPKGGRQRNKLEGSWDDVS
jgi:hypothetical protein